METPEALQQCVRREQQMSARLRLAMTRLADAGLSIRQIARATSVSLTRIHQLLQADEARAIPVWLSHLQDQHFASAVQSEGVPSALSSPGGATWPMNAPLLRRLRYAAKQNFRPAASTVCALRRI